MSDTDVPEVEKQEAEIRKTIPEHYYNKSKESLTIEALNSIQAEEYWLAADAAERAVKELGNQRFASKEDWHEWAKWRSYNREHTQFAFEIEQLKEKIRSSNKANSIAENANRWSKGAFVTSIFAILIAGFGIFNDWNQQQPQSSTEVHSSTPAEIPAQQSPPSDNSEQ